MTDIETRSFRVPFELRTDGENQTIVGYASTFDQPYPVDMVTEIIDRSAFTRTLSEKPDVYALIGHDPSRILGRTKNGTLSLSIDERGLKCVITPVMTRDAEDTLKLIASGCIDAMSFGFKVVKQAFGYADGKTTRRITDLELHEVSCVAFPANENATLSLRAKQMARKTQFENRAYVGNDRWQGNYGDIEIPPEAWQEMSGSGQKDSAVSRWVNSPKIVWTMDDEAIAKELKEHGAWSEKELSNAKENKKRLLWIASNDISEEEGRSSTTRLETRKTKERVFTATSSEERGRWEIDVELNGKTVFRYDSDSHNPDEEGYEPTEGGWMKNLTDYQGLADWMSHMGVMDKGETLVVERGSDKGRYYARSASAQLETRGAQLIMAFLPPNQTFKAFFGDPKSDPSEWSAENNLLQNWGAPINTKKELKYFADQEKYTLKQISSGIYTLTGGGSRSSSAMQLLELRNRIASPIDTETRGLADFALMASAGLGLFLVSKIVSGVLFFWYDCAYNTYGGGKKKVRVSAKTDKDAMAEVKKLNPEAQDIEVQKVKK
jgi:uncharacterized protein